MKNLSFDDYFMSMAELVATKSKDRSTKVGCVIVGPNHEVRTTGYNGFCRGVNDDVEERHDRPEKYLWVEHAERNAIYNAARNGIPLECCTAYVSSTIPPCAECTRALIQSGISRVVTAADENTCGTIWAESFARSKLMMNESNVALNTWINPNG